MQRECRGCHTFEESSWASHISSSTFSLRPCKDLLEEIESLSSSGLTMLYRIPDDPFWPSTLSSFSNMTPGESTICRSHSSSTPSYILAAPQRYTPMTHTSPKIENKNSPGTTLACLSVLIRLLLPTLVGEANDAEGDAPCRAWFVRLEEAEKCRGRARFQFWTLMLTRRAEWERQSCVAEQAWAFSCSTVYSMLQH